MYLIMKSPNLICQVLIQQKRHLNQLFSKCRVSKLYLNTQYRQCSSLNKNKLNIGIVGIPLSEGQCKKGVEEGPSVIRKFGLIERLQDLGHDINDYGDINFENVECSSETSTAKKAKYVGTANKKISEVVSEVINNKRICVNLGGDHSLIIGSALGHRSAKTDTCVLFVDAHSDINTPRTSPSGNIHGMGIAFILTEMQEYVGTVPGFEWVKERISKKNLAYIGLRSVDPPEKKFLEELNIKHYSMRDVDKYGIYKVVNMALENINPSGNLPIHVSFDIDALDKMIAPSTGTPVSGGLTLREAFVIGEEIAKTGNLSVLDLVEVNPKLCQSDDVEETVLAAIDVISSFFPVG